MRAFYLFILILQALTLRLHAQETDGFEHQINAGLTLTEGNSNTTLVRAGVESKNIHEHQETFLTASYEYGRTEEQLENGEEREKTHLDRSKLTGQSNWLFSQELYAFYNLTAERDELAKLEYRINNGPGLGYYFLREEDRLLNTETSIVYVMEDVDGMSDDYAAVRLAQKLEVELSEGARVWQNLEGVVNLSDSEDYFLNAEVGAEARIHQNLSLRIVLQNKYDNDPGPEVEKNDLTLFSGISVRL